MSVWNLGRVLESTAAGRACLKWFEELEWPKKTKELVYFEEMPRKDFEEWLDNVSSACEEHGACSILLDFFTVLGLAGEFDHAWQHDVFNDWTWNPTPERLEELVEVVRFGRY